MSSGNHLFAYLGIGLALVAAAQGATTPPAADEERAAAAFAARDWPTAREVYERLARAQPQSAAIQYRLGTSRLYTGAIAPGREALARAEALGHPAAQVAYRLAGADAASGQLDAAIAQLRRASAAGFGQLALLDSDSLLAPLRADARWSALRKELDQAVHPCRYDAKFRAFDFWVGEWDVRPNGAPASQPPAENIVTLEYDDCVVHEHWRSPNSTGESFNIFDASRGEWFQTWVDNSGGLHQYRGNADGDGNMRFTTDLPYTAGGPRLPTRLTFFKTSADEVRQLSERSEDGGKTWLVNYDLIYRRRKAASG